MAPQYWEKFDYDDESDGRVYCAPEIVSHAGNAGWDGFYAQMNAQFVQIAKRNKSSAFQSIPELRCGRKEISLFKKTKRPSAANSQTDTV